MVKPKESGGRPQKERAVRGEPNNGAENGAWPQNADVNALQMPLTKSKAELEGAMSWVDALVICASRDNRNKMNDLKETDLDESQYLIDQCDRLEAEVNAIFKSATQHNELTIKVEALRRVRNSMDDWLFDWKYAPATLIHRDIIAQMTLDLVNSLRAGNKIAYARHDGTETHMRIDPIEWEGEWEFSPEFSEVVRKKPKLRLNEVRIFDAPCMGITQPAEEETRGRKPRDGMADVFGALVRDLAENGYPGRKEATWKRYCTIAEGLGVEPLGFSRFREQSIERLGIKWWNRLGKDDPELK